MTHSASEPAVPSRMENIKEYAKIALAIGVIVGMGFGAWAIDSRSQRNLDRSEELFLEGNLLFEQDRYAAAIDCYSESLARVQPRLPDAWTAPVYHNRGWSHLYNGDPDLAILDFETVMWCDWTPLFGAKARLGRGMAYALKGERERAKADFDTAIRLASKAIRNDSCDQKAIEVRQRAYKAQDTLRLAGPQAFAQAML